MRFLTYMLFGGLGALLGWILSEPWVDNFSDFRDFLILFSVSLGITLGLLAERYFYFGKTRELPKLFRKYQIYIIPLVGAFGVIALLSGKVNEEELPNIDIAFLIDTSGSMTNELDGVKDNCIKFARNIKKRGANIRLGLIDFDKPDSGNEHNFEIFPLQRDFSAFRQSIKKLRIARIGGYGCYVGNRSTLRVFQAVPNIFDNNGNEKALIMISDEVGNNEVTDDIIQILQQNDITVHTVGVSGDNPHTRITQATGGRFWDIEEGRSASFSFLLENIADEIKSNITGVGEKQELPLGRRALAWGLFGLIIGITIATVEKVNSKRKASILGGLLGGLISVFLLVGVNQLGLSSPMSRMLSFALLGIIIGFSISLVDYLFRTMTR